VKSVLHTAVTATLQNNCNRINWQYITLYLPHVPFMPQWISCFYKKGWVKDLLHTNTHTKVTLKDSSIMHNHRKINFWFMEGMVWCQQNQFH